MGVCLRAELLFMKHSKRMANKTMDNYHLKARFQMKCHRKR